jgi:hypothetical protein
MIDVAMIDELGGKIQWKISIVSEGRSECLIISQNCALVALGANPKGLRYSVGR